MFLLFHFFSFQGIQVFYDDENGECDNQKADDGIDKHTVVDRDGLSPHVAFPCVRAGFPASPCLLLSPEGPADFGARRSDVYIGDAAIRPGVGEKLFRLPQT